MAIKNTKIPSSAVFNGETASSGLHALKYSLRRYGDFLFITVFK
jgi:hypothetical protein